MSLLILEFPLTASSLEQGITYLVMDLRATVQAMGPTLPPQLPVMWWMEPASMD